MPLLNTNPTLNFLDVAGGYSTQVPIILVSGVAAVDNHIDNTLLTPIGTEIFEPEFGCNWEYELFNNPSDTSGQAIANSIVIPIRTWLTYMQIGRVAVSASYSQGYYIVNMPYIVPTINLPGRYVSGLGNPN